MEVRTLLNEQELALIQCRSNLKASALVALNYALTACAFSVMVLWTNAITIVLGIILLGTRQLGFGVLVHECGHGTLFESRRLNKMIGEWLAAAPTFNNMQAYSTAHIKHHRMAGTNQDPDLVNYRDYPISTQRLRRKLLRDITGRTGWRQTRGLVKSLLTLFAQKSEKRSSLVRGLVVHTIAICFFTYVGFWWLYAVWWIAELTTSKLFSRLRQVAEHAAVPNLYDRDPRKNTRTIPANWFDQLIFCPLGVSYHMEHHIMASVPIYNLPQLHQILKEKGYYDDVSFPTSYLGMLNEVLLPKT